MISVAMKMGNKTIMWISTNDFTEETKLKKFIDNFLEIKKGAIGAFLMKQYNLISYMHPSMPYQL